MPQEHILPAIPIVADEDIVSAAQRVVRFKEALDDLCYSSDGTWIVEQLCPRLLNMAKSAIDGSAFVAAILPFIGAKAPEVRGLIDVKAVIGESWDWRSLKAESRMTEEELLAFLTHPDRAWRQNDEYSLTTYIAPLGLAVALEGKNRVRFLRSHAVKQMPTAVEIAEYPTPERLRVYHVRTVHGNHAWCVLDERWLAPLPLPYVTHMILDPYGVTTDTWPAEWPAVERVVDAVAEAKAARHHGPVDLRLLRERQARADVMESRSESWANTSMMALRVYRPRWPLLLGGFACLLGAFLATDYLPAGWKDSTAWGIAGLAVGLTVAWAAPLVQARRKHLR